MLSVCPEHQPCSGGLSEWDREAAPSLQGSAWKSQNRDTERACGAQEVQADNFNPPISSTLIISP